MTIDDLRRLLIAPEIIVLASPWRPLRPRTIPLLEHPLLHAPPSADDPRARQRARAALRRASRLRRSLRGYRDVVDVILRKADRDDSPF